MSDKILSLRLPVSLHTRLKALAFKKGETIRLNAISALQDYISKEELKIQHKLDSISTEAIEKELERRENINASEK